MGIILVFRHEIGQWHLDDLGQGDEINHDVPQSPVNAIAAWLRLEEEVFAAKSLGLKVEDPRPGVEDSHKICFGDHDFSFSMRTVAFC